MMPAKKVAKWQKPRSEHCNFTKKIVSTHCWNSPCAMTENGSERKTCQLTLWILHTRFSKPFLTWNSKYITLSALTALPMAHTLTP